MHHRPGDGHNDTAGGHSGGGARGGGAAGGPASGGGAVSSSFASVTAGSSSSLADDELASLVSMYELPPMAMPPTFDFGDMDLGDLAAK